MGRECARRGFLALGDSYTIGEGVAPAARWPAQLARSLRGQGIRIDDPLIVAATGWTTAELSAALDAATLDPPYALVTLLVGVNDQYRGHRCAEFGPGFGVLLQRAIALAGGSAARVVAMSIPDWGVTPFARQQGRDAAQVAAGIDAFNVAARGITGRAGCRWVNVTGISRSAAASAELAADGLHPSGPQYARWVREILPAARAALAGA